MEHHASSNGPRGFRVQAPLVSSPDLLNVFFIGLFLLF
jgi:hypothetical protein